MGVHAVRYPRLLTMPPGTGLLPWSAFTSPYEWEARGAALEVETGGVWYAAGITSTSTVYLERWVANDGILSGWSYLRLYGLNDGVPAFASDGRVLQLVSTPNVTVPGVPVAYYDATRGTSAPNIAYWDSLPVVLHLVVGGTPSPALRYRFRAHTPDVLTATAIPGVVDKRTLDGVPDQYAAYKDVHVLELKHSTGGPRGWLMTAVRYTADKLIGVGYDPIGPENTRAAVVGFWSADPGFATEVWGPFFLVGRQHDVDLDGTQVRVPLWLGVPCAAEVEVDGEWWLYVYYTAEDTEVEPRALPGGHKSLSNFSTWQPGTFVRRIRLDDLPWTSAVPRATVGNGVGGYGSLTRNMAADELAWNSATEDRLVRGEALGKVRLWASGLPYSTGGVVRGSVWAAGGDPAVLGNVLIWEIQETLKDVDGVAVSFPDGLALYVALNFKDVDSKLAAYDAGWHFWGLWRAVAGPAPAGRVYGTDFAIRWIDEPDVGAAYDCVARSNDTDFTGTWWDDKSQIRLDPDPVRLPTGEWIVFSGSDPTGSPKPLERFETSAYNGDRSFAEAW